jgi:hypothetical protein
MERELKAREVYHLRDRRIRNSSPAVQMGWLTIELTLMEASEARYRYMASRRAGV